MVRREILAVFEGKQKGAKISEAREVAPTKLGAYRIGGIICGEKISQISCFRKNYTQKTKKLYDSHLIFDRFAKF